MNRSLNVRTSHPLLRLRRRFCARRVIEKVNLSPEMRRVAELCNELCDLRVQKDFLTGALPKRFCAVGSDPFLAHEALDEAIERISGELRSLGFSPGK